MARRERRSSTARTATGPLGKCAACSLESWMDVISHRASSLVHSLARRREVGALFAELCRPFRLDSLPRLHHRWILGGESRGGLVLQPGAIPARQLRRIE